MSAPRLQPRLLPCRRCGTTEHLRIAPVREHGQGGAPTPMAVAWLPRRREPSRLARAVSCVGPKEVLQPFGSWVVIVCRGCGEAGWYARDLDPEPAAELQPAVNACECGEQRALRVPVARTRGAGGDPSPLRVVHYTTRRWGFSSTGSAGSFSTIVCRGCGRATWVAEGLEGRHLHTHDAAPCGRCRTARRVTIAPVNEDGATLRVLYDREHLRDVRIGSYALSICAGCGTTGWTAQELSSLVPDSRFGVSLLSAEDEHEGPYR